MEVISNTRDCSDICCKNIYILLKTTEVHQPPKKCTYKREIGIRKENRNENVYISVYTNMSTFYVYGYTYVNTCLITCTESHFKTT